MEKSHILYFKQKNYQFFQLLEKVCSVYERDYGIKSPYRGDVFADFIPIFEGLHKTPDFKRLGIGRGILIFVAMTHIWSKYKQEYSYNTEFAKELVEMELPDNLPKEVLMHPPFNCIYVHDPVENDISDGWYFLLENDVLIVLAIKDMGDDQNFNIKTWALDFKVGTHINQIIKFEKRDGMSSLKRALNLYMYLCSDKPEVSKPTPVIKAIKQEKSWKKYSSNILQVGVRIGKFLKSSGIKSQSSSGTGSAKVGHLRRAHWHHYWIGKKDNQSIILKWIHPVLVNSGEETVKINKVS